MATARGLFAYGLLHTRLQSKKGLLVSPRKGLRSVQRGHCQNSGSRSYCSPLVITSHNHEAVDEHEPVDWSHNVT